MASVTTEFVDSTDSSKVVDVVRIKKPQLDMLEKDGDANCPRVNCSHCGRSELLSSLHELLFSQWYRRPDGSNYLPAVRIAESKVSPVAGKGLFASQSIPKGSLITYYPVHGVISSENEGIDHSLFVELSNFPRKEMENLEEFESKLTRRSLSHLVNGCGFDFISWPSSTRRKDEFGDCANDNIDFFALLPFFSSFIKSPSPSTYDAFCHAVDSYKEGANCSFVTNCLGKRSEDGSLAVRAARHGTKPHDTTVVPVPSLIASRDIKDGDELTVPYGARYWLFDMFVRHKRNTSPDQSTESSISELAQILEFISCPSPSLTGESATEAEEQTASASSK